MDSLTLDAIDHTLHGKIATESYQKPHIDGVQIFSLNTYLAEDGSFTELLRLTADGNTQLVPNFHIAQINRSVVLPGAVKAWHFHFHQDEIWNVGMRSQVQLGLWDIREKSPTKGLSMRIPLTKDRLVYIPRGVAHGVANHLTHATEILYFVSTQYNKETPDEQRLPWDSLGNEFWEMKKE